MNFEELLKDVPMGLSLVETHVELRNENLQNVRSYNTLIRSLELDSQRGVYVISGDGKVKYIGMAGQFKTGLGFVEHGVGKRLLRQRILRGKKMSTYSWLAKLKSEEQLKTIAIDVLICPDEILPGMVEGQLIQKYFERYRMIPQWNKAF